MVIYYTLGGKRLSKNEWGLLGVMADNIQILKGILQGRLGAQPVGESVQPFRGRSCRRGF